MIYKVVLRKNHKILPNEFINLKCTVAFITGNFLNAYIIIKGE